MQINQKNQEFENLGIFLQVHLCPSVRFSIDGSLMFPRGYLFVLTDDEKHELVKNFDRFESMKHSSVLPTAFTERVLYMLATILKSKQAVQTTIAIIDTFAMVRQMASTMERLQRLQMRSCSPMREQFLSLLPFAYLPIG